MAAAASGKIDRGEIQWTTRYLESSKNPLHQQILQILTNGYAVGTPIKEGKKDAQ